MTTTGAPAAMQVQRIHDASGSHIEPPLGQRWSELDKLRWQAAVVKEDTGVTIRVYPDGFRRFRAALVGAGFCHPVAETDRMTFHQAWYWMHTVSCAAEIGRHALRSSLAASDSPPGAVGLGLVPLGPNPTEMQEERDEEGFTAAERAESLARAEQVFNTLPTAEQVERGKEAARKRARE